MTTGARQAHALLLAARKLVRQARAHDRQGARGRAHGRRARAISSRGRRRFLKTEGDVVAHRHVRKDGVVLEHQADIAAIGGHVVDALAGDQHLAAVLAD